MLPEIPFSYQNTLPETTPTEIIGIPINQVIMWEGSAKSYEVFSMGQSEPLL